jgi:high-affinity iron transporter
MGTGVGFVICMIIGGGIIGAFYAVGKNSWTMTEYYWEGAFALFAAVIITILGAALLRISRMQEKWRVKLTKAMEAKVGTTGNRNGTFKRWCEKYTLFILPFITVLREGLEGVVFVAGVSFSAPASAVPLPVVCGVAAGCFVGYFIFK